jgi:hypothetical protein
MFEFDSVSTSVASDGDFVRVNPKDVVGHLLLVWVIDYIDDSPTKFSKPDKKSDVIVVDAIDLDQRDPDTGRIGLVGRKCWWRQAQLISNLKDSIGKPNPKLARMAKGVATKGLPPYILEDARGDQNAVNLASAWMRENPDFKPSVATPQTSTMASQAVENSIASAPRPPESELERMARLASQPDARNAGGNAVYYGTDLPKPNLPPAPPLPDEPPF